jgi:hypothetical protein
MSKLDDVSPIYRTDRRPATFAQSATDASEGIICYFKPGRSEIATYNVGAQRQAFITIESDTRFLEWASWCHIGEGLTFYTGGENPFSIRAFEFNLLR